MKDFIKYFGLGLIGLSLTLALPNLPINWAAIVLAQAYLSGPRRLAPWLALIALAALYSAFSLSGIWGFAGPWLLAWGICLILRKPFQWEGPEERVLVLSLLSVLPLLSVGSLGWLRSGIWLLDWKDWIGVAATFSVGCFAAPLFRRLAIAFRRRLGRLWPGRSGVDLSRADWLSARGTRFGRKPFGLEKGL